MSGPLKPIFDAPPGALDALARRAAEATSLTGRVRRALSPPLGEHLISASRREEDLVLVVDSAAWAARVRYAGPALREALAAAGEPVPGRVRIKVRGRARGPAGPD
jgi:hypothetical protein